MELHRQGLVLEMQVPSPPPPPPHRLGSVSLPLSISRRKPSRFNHFVDFILSNIIQNCTDDNINLVETTVTVPIALLESAATFRDGQFQALDAVNPY